MNTKQKGYVTLEQARKLFETIDGKKDVQGVRESIKNRHINNVKEAKTIEGLSNLLKNHIRLIELSDEHREQWRYDLIERINERMEQLNTA